MSIRAVRTRMCALRGAPRPGRTGSVEVQARAAPTSSLTEFDCAVGDPGLQIFTNVSIEDKTSLLPKLSEIVARSLSKPESYVCVHVVDQQAMCWGGDPTAGCALGSVFSIGSITKENNAQISKEVMELLEPYGINPSQFYIEFKDVSAQNTGYKGSTFG